MPYIKKETRYELFHENGSIEIPETPGELNFMITTLCTNYRDSKGLSYQTVNDIIGALEGAKLEFYRRVVAPYEDTKIIENGDVY